MNRYPDPRTYRWPAHADTQAGDFKPHLPGAAPMSFQITENFVQQFGTNFPILGQQRRSPLWAYCQSAGNITGTSTSFERLGMTEAYDIPSRHAAPNSVDTPHPRRCPS